MDGIVIFNNEGAYLAAKVHCEWTVDNAACVVDQVQAEAEKCGSKHVLLDLSLWTSPPSEMVRFCSGEYLAEKLKTIKVAAFARLEHINKFGEIVATNRGAHYSIFPDRTEALKWLLSRPACVDRAAERL